MQNLRAVQRVQSGILSPSCTICTTCRRYKAVLTASTENVPSIFVPRAVWHFVMSLYPSSGRAGRRDQPDVSHAIHIPRTDQIAGPGVIDRPAEGLLPRLVFPFRI